MERVKLIFIGTGGIGEELLKALAADDRFQIMMVVTGLDKPAGRKMELRPPPYQTSGG